MLDHTRRYVHGVCLDIRSASTPPALFSGEVIRTMFRGNADMLVSPSRLTGRHETDMSAATLLEGCGISPQSPFTLP